MAVSYERGTPVATTQRGKYTQLREANSHKLEREFVLQREVDLEREVAARLLARLPEDITEGVRG